MAEVTTLGASHLASQNFEVQRTNNFEIQIEGVSAISDTNTRNLTLAVVSGFLPNESNEVITLNYGNTSVTVAGKANVNGSGSLVVRDIISEGSDVEKLIDQWRSTVFDKATKKIGFAYDYKKTAKITQYAPDGTLLRSWNLTGVWPSAVDYGSISYDSPGIKTINITLQYDLAEIDRQFYSNTGITPT